MQRDGEATIVSTDSCGGVVGGVDLGGGGVVRGAMAAIIDDRRRLGERCRTGGGQQGGGSTALTVGSRPKGLAAGGEQRANGGR
jgi:hypothetical protein